MNRRPLSRAEKSLFAVSFFSLLVIGGGALFAARDAEPDWGIRPAPPLPTPNGFDLHLEAANSAVRFTPEIDPILELPDAKISPENHSLARRRKWLDANARMWTLFAQALETPTRFPGDKSGNRWAKLRQLARDNAARAQTLKLAGQPFEATKAALDGVEFGEEISRGGRLVSRLAGMAISRIGREPLEDWNQTIEKLSAEEAKIAAQRLEKILQNSAPFSQTLDAERQDELRWWREGVKTPHWRTHQDGGWKYNLRAQTVSKHLVARKIHENHDQARTELELPYSELQALPEPVLDGTPVVWMLSNADQFRPAIGNFYRHQIATQMLLLRLALRSYTAQNGRAPQKLSELTPAILRAVPTDVYNDGKPFFYQNNGAKYRLWSVGPNGVNDGGVPLERKPNGKSHKPAPNLYGKTLKGDFVAILCR